MNHYLAAHNLLKFLGIANDGSGRFLIGRPRPNQRISHGHAFVRPAANQQIAGQGFPNVRLSAKSYKFQSALTQLPNQPNLGAVILHILPTASWKARPPTPCEKGGGPMGPDVSPPVTSSSRFPRILIAENNVATVKSLIGTFGDRRLDVDYDVCTSHDYAILKLFHSPPPYQLVISSARLAEVDDFFLLKHNRNRQPFVPFLITSGAADTESSRRALEEGAFDLIPTPLEHEPTVNTICLALWHNKLKALIASRDKALERCRQHIVDYPGDRTGKAFGMILTSIEQTVSAYERTIRGMEGSIKCFTDLAESLKKEAREIALRRLVTLRR